MMVMFRHFRACTYNDSSRFKMCNCISLVQEEGTRGGKRAQGGSRGGTQGGGRAQGPVEPGGEPRGMDPGRKPGGREGPGPSGPSVTSVCLKIAAVIVFLAAVIGFF